MTDAFTLLLYALFDQPVLFILGMIAVEIPRYTLGFATLAFRQIFRPSSQASHAPSISAIVPAYNGATGLQDTVTSLLCNDADIIDILIVNDGSSDSTANIAAELEAEHSKVHVITHARRTGKSAAINHAANYARGELLLMVDVDTVLECNAVSALASAFADPKVGIASGDVLVSNTNANALTAMQSLEYLMAISVGRYFLDRIGAIACCSGAFSMIRKSVFDEINGFDVGPGEDLEITLRIRNAGYQTRFVKRATAYTMVPDTLGRLLKQRQRWDRDAINIRALRYREIFPSLRRHEKLGDTLERMDFIILGILPVLALIPYLVYLATQFSDVFSSLMIAIYLTLLPFYLMNVILGFAITKTSPTFLQICVLPLMPFYQGYFLKLGTFAAFTSEILFATSRADTFVPTRVRNALYEEGATV